MLYFDVEADWQKFQQLRLEITRLEKALNDINANRTVSETVKLENELSKMRAEMEKLSKSAAVAGYDMEKGLERSIANQTQLMQDYNAKIIENRKELLETQKIMREINADANKIVVKGTNGKVDKTATEKARKKFKVENDYGQYEEQAEKNAKEIDRLREAREKLNISIQRSRSEYELLIQQQAKATTTAQNVSSAVTKFAAALGGAKLIKDFGQRMVQTRAEFQQMEAALNTMVGSDKAGQLMTELKEIAKQSPLTMQSMVSAEKTMLGFGISANKTTKYIKALSDVSMGDAGKFNALTLAFSQMSAAGKLMGQDLLQMINAGFNPLEQISKTTGKSIAKLKEEMSKGAISAEMVQKAFMDATSAGGKFAGMSEATAKTINGQMSMLNDALDNMFNELGKSAEGFVVNGISKITSLVQSYEELVPAIEATVAALGMAKAASLAYIKVQEMSTVAARVYGVSLQNVTTKQKLHIAVTNAAKKAQLALNAAMKAAPWAIAAAAVGALVYAAIQYNNKQKEIHASETRLGEAMATTAEKTEKEQTRLNILAGELDGLTEGTDEYNKKKKELVDFAAQYDKSLATEIENTNNLTSAYDKLSIAIEEVNKKRMALDFFKSETQAYEEGNAAFIQDEGKKLKERFVKKAGSPEEEAERILAVNKLIGEIEKGLTEGALSVGQSITYFADGTSNVHEYIQGLSEESSNLLETMRNNSEINGAVRFFNALKGQIEKNEVTIKVINAMLEQTGQDYASLANGYLEGIDNITQKAKDATDKIEKNWDKKKVEQQRDIAETAKSETDAILKNLQNLREQAEKRLANAENEEVQKNLEKQIESIENQIKDVTTNNLNVIQGYVDTINGQISNIENEKLPAAVKRAKKEWQDAERVFLATKSDPTKTKKQYDEAKADLDTKKKNYQAVGGKPIDYEQRVENERKANEEIAKMRRDHTDRLNEFEKDENKKKTNKIISDYEKQLADIEKKKKDAEKRYKDGTLTKSQYDTMLELYKEESEDAEKSRDYQLKEQNKALIDNYLEYDKRRREIDEKYEHDKAALQAIIADEKATAEQKAAAKKASVKLEEQHNKQQIDLGLEQLQNGNEWKMVFQNLNNYGFTTLTNLKKKLDELGKGLTENMNPADLQAYNEALQNLQLRLMDFAPKQAFENAKAEVDEKKEMLRRAQIYAQIANGTNEEAEATKKLTNAENDLAQATERYNNAAQKYAEHVTKMIEPLKTLGNQMIDVGNSSDTMAGEILATIGTVIDASMQMIDTITQAATKSADAVQKTTDVASETAETTKKGAEVASQAISAVEKASVILAIISAVLQVAQAIDQMLEKRKNEAAEKQAEIARMQAAVNDYKMAVLEAQQAEKGWFNASGMQNLEKEYEKGQQALKNYYDTANRMEEKYQEEQGGGFLKKAGNFGTKLGGIVGDTVGEGLRKVGMDAVADVFEYADLTQLTEKAYQAANGEEWGSGHDTMYNLGKGKADMVSARDNLRIRTQKAKNGVLGIGAKDEKTEDLETWLKNNGFEGSLFGEDGMIDIQAADAVLDQFGDKLVGNTKETIEQLKEAKEQYDEWLESLKEYTSEMFGGLTDDLVDSLFNWLDTGEDVMDNFEKSAKETFRSVAKDMIKTLSNKMIFDGFGDKIAKIYQQSQKGGWSTEQLATEVANAGNQLKEDVRNALPVMQEVTKTIADTMGIVGGENAEQQSAVAGAFQTMSEDTAGVLEARFTAVYESNLAIQGILNGIGGNIGKLTDVAVGNYQINNDIRNIVVDSNLHLQTIAENSIKIEKLCTTISADLYNVNQNTKKL